MSEFDPARIDVLLLLQRLGIQYRPRGDDRLQARCPSGTHSDIHPSWDIKVAPGSDSNGIHSCLSCKWGGAAYELVQHRLGFATATAAVQWITENAMLDLAPSLDVELVVRGTRERTFTLPHGVKCSPIDEWVTGARRYAVKRGITAEQAHRWQIGYAALGRLAGRIVFPVRSSSGILLNYSARTFISSDEKRYLTPHWTERPDLGAVFGEEHWPEHDRDHRVVVVNEGAINALACERAGAQYIAALSGSKLHRMQVAKLATFGGVVVLSDDDLAGNSVARELRAALSRHTRVARVTLGSDEDAADVTPPRLAALLAPFFEIARWPVEQKSTRASE